jgi:hypothetical protein
MLSIFTIRNYFAHNLDMSFEAAKYPEMAKALAKLVLHEDRTMYPDVFITADTPSDFPIGEIKTMQDRFLANLKMALILLGKDHDTHLTWSNAPSNVTFSRAPPSQSP